VPTPICNDQGGRGDTPCIQPGTGVLRLLDACYLTCQPHGELTRDEYPPGEVAIYPMTYDGTRNLATWSEGDEAFAAKVIALPEGGTALRLVSPDPELRCLTCGIVTFKATATVPVSIQLDTEDGDVTAVKVLEGQTGPPTDFQCTNGHPADDDLAAALLTLTKEVDWPAWTVA
jgi:hypothetical protein